MTDEALPANRSTPATPVNRGTVDEGIRRNFTAQARGEEARNFDYIAMRPPGPRTTVIQSIGHLIKSCLGGGIVSIHESYKTCGLWAAFTLNIFLGLFVSYCMIMLAQNAQRIYGRAKVHTLSYPEVAEASLMISSRPKFRKFSRMFRYLVDTTIMIDLFGSCCCYQVLIATQTTQLMQHFFNVSLNVRIYIIMLLIPCIAICMILSLKYLSPFSLFADFVILFVAFATIYYGSKNAVSLNRSPTSMEFWAGDVARTFQFIGGCVFSMEGVGATMPIENNMVDATKITRVLVIGMFIVTTLVMIVGFFGYWGWAEHVVAPVTVNFPMNWLTVILKIALPIMVYITFALNFWVPFNLAWVYLKGYWPNMNIKLKERIWRIIFVIVITLISTIFPQVVLLMSVLGAFCLSNMGFLYPAFTELVLDIDEPGLGTCKWRLIRFVFIAIFSFMLMIVGTISASMDLIQVVFSEKADMFN